MKVDEQSKLQLGNSFQFANIFVLKIFTCEKLTGRSFC